MRFTLNAILTQTRQFYNLIGWYNSWKDIAELKYIWKDFRDMTLVLVLTWNKWFANLIRN
jgi:hypothetical protein